MNRTTTTKGWSYSVGERGRNRVRVYARDGSGKLFLEFYEPTRAGGRPKVKRVALGHSDRDAAKAAAERLAAELRTAIGAPDATVEHITLSALFDNYLREVTPDKGASKRQHDRRCAEMFLRALGGATEARALSRREWDRLIRDRRSGELRPKGSARRPVRDRVIGYDLLWLRAVLNWGAMASNGRGGFLLDRNPLQGLDVPTEHNPVRSTLSDDQYRALLTVAPTISPLFEVALVLARETGHRIGAVRQLRWSDVDLEAGRITWRARTDKIGFEHATPLTPEAAEVLRREQARQEGEATVAKPAWVLPSPGTPGEPCSRHLMRDYWERAAKAAGLPKGRRLGYHSLRRQFATELKDVPLKDLCVLGGWKEPQTILRCYMQPDEETMRAALAQRRRIAAA